MMKTCWVFMGMNQETWWFHWIEATKMMISYDFDGMRKMKNRDLLIFFCCYQGDNMYSVVT